MSKIRVINEGGEVACEHRDLSVCHACFLQTPGLVDVYATVFYWRPNEWPERDRTAILAGTLPGTHLSPGS